MSRRVITIRGSAAVPVLCIALMVAACFGAFFGLIVWAASGDPDSVAPQAEGTTLASGLVFLLGSVAVFALSGFSLKTRDPKPLAIAGATSVGLLILYAALTG